MWLLDIYLVKFIHLIALYIIFGFWKFLGVLFSVIFGFWKLLKMVLEWECVTWGGLFSEIYSFEESLYDFWILGIFGVLFWVIFGFLKFSKMVCEWECVNLWGSILWNLFIWELFIQFLDFVCFWGSFLESYLGFGNFQSWFWNENVWFWRVYLVKFIHLRGLYMILEFWYFLGVLFWGNFQVSEFFLDKNVWLWGGLIWSFYDFWMFLGVLFLG